MLPLFPDRAQLAPLKQAWTKGATLSPKQQLLLAWGLRQAEPELALQLSQQLEAQLPSEADAAPARSHDSRLRARLLLLRAESQLLHGELDAVEPMLAAAMEQFSTQQDALGVADTHWLRYYLAADQGRAAEVHSALELAAATAQTAGDASRALLFRASLARAAVFVRPAQTPGDAELELPQHSDTLPAMEAAALEDFHGLLAGMNGHFAEALTALTRAHELSLQTGQLRRAITVATNIGHTYSRMGEFQTAMAWLERALDLARQSRWPSLVSLCLAHAGEATRRLGRPQDARSLLNECLELNAEQAQSRTAALALSYLGHTELDSGDGLAARRAFTTLLQAAEPTPDLEAQAHLGLARAELLLQHFARAREYAQQGLLLAQEQTDPAAEVDFLWVLADIAKAEPRDSPHGRSDLQVLSLYMEALLRAEAVEPHVPDPHLLEATAQAFAACGGYERAYHMLYRASLLRQRRAQQDAMLNMTALRTHHQLEKEREARSHLQALARAESRRAQELDSSNQLLQRLSQVGQAITHELRHERIFEVLASHCQDLLGAPCQAIWLLEDEGRLQCAYAAPGLWADPVSGDFPWNQSTPEPDAWRCARTRKDVMHDLEGRALASAGDAAIGHIHSPLVCGDRVLGVVTFHAPEGRGLNAQQLLAWHSLQAFTAIALDNANIHRRVAELRQQLMAREKMLALATLVAGMAHELNTPVGNSRLVASTLLDQLRQIEQGLAQQSLRRSTWREFASQAHEGLQLINRNMERADGLVSSFKQFAEHRDSEVPQHFELRSLCERCAQAVTHRLDTAGLRWRNEVPEGLRVFGHPAALSQVLSILIANALDHAFEGRRHGNLVLGCARLETQGYISLWLQDDGCGIEAELLDRIFDPFFTTRIGQGGQGLGLSVALNLVNGLMGGSLRARSSIGRGSRFQIDLPLLGTPPSTAPSAHFEASVSQLEAPPFINI